MSKVNRGTGPKKDIFEKSASERVMAPKTQSEVEHCNRLAPLVTKNTPSSIAPPPGITPILENKMPTNTSKMPAQRTMMFLGLRPSVAACSRLLMESFIMA